ncbi:hypothetical protein HMPREF1624_00728 [Sporothrix schenckii ATCC 58251]|uniref:Uncharacterized protein n=1 Tax=Sporothrix schenckii (strain ATCC 58251 / de Perez 2211183) TaxID=1391915 RepID=U7Q609_SPOS1|nr:hypothetical protein HMPREF1624_00728 [Sporothrix schenckii ATCC 58251]
MPPALQGLSEGDANARRPSRPPHIDKGSLAANADGVFQLPSPEPSPIDPHVDLFHDDTKVHGDVRETDNDTKRTTLTVRTTNSAADMPDKTLTSTSPSIPVASPKIASPTNPSGVRRLSASQMAELAASLPIAALPDNGDLVTGGVVGKAVRSGFSPPLDGPNTEPAAAVAAGQPDEPRRVQRHWNSTGSLRTLSTPPTSRRKSAATQQQLQQHLQQPATQSTQHATAPVASNTGTRRHSQNTAPRPPPLNTDGGTAGVAAGVAAGAGGPTAALRSAPQLGLGPNGEAPVHTPTHLPPSHSEHRLPSPIPPSIPLPPMSLPTLLQLELAGQRPSPLYIHHSYASDIPYESHAVKFERLKNFLLLPTYLERTMYFGALACLDAWLWTLTILPLRFCIAASVLVRWWGYVVWKEVRWMTAYVWRGLGRMWRRGRQPKPKPVTTTATGGRPRGRSNGSSVSDTDGPRGRRHVQAQAQQAHGAEVPTRPSQRLWGHRRTKSMPSNLTSFHKADLLQGAVIVCSSLALMNLDASRMYHFVRAQSAVKLYVIYNLVEVGDRLLSALGQDIFECLFSAETLSRTASGRSKILLPFGMFCLALVYNIAHTTVLFYQVITLNVAVNSYSNALLSLLMSNQFVEVKSSVFKRTEKENTFQLACADIVERFQLWIVLFIIALRNVVEIGGLSVPGAGLDLGASGLLEDMAAKVPLHNASILPASFTILPSWLTSVEVLSPFLIVIGSEMVVDWIKHGYINKFNNIKPAFYSRILDILCKDYYTNAFLAPALIRRLGLPLIPLCTLFLRSSVQTYHMFLATHLPSPLPPSTHTSLVAEAATPSSPAMAASLERLDLLIRNALGRAVHGNPYAAMGGDAAAGASSSSSLWLWRWSSDDLIAGVTMVVVFFLMFLILLIAKLLLGMALLRYARNRYANMKRQEHAEALGQAEPASFDATGKRTGGYGKVEVGEDRRRWIFQDDAEGLKKVRDRERRETGKGKKDKEMDLNKITRYEMVAKRIW